MPAGDRCALRLIRRSQYADYLRSYDIFINGTHAGKLARDSVLALEVPSGPLTIEAQIDWGRSRPLAIETKPGQSIEVEVFNTWGALLSLWAVTFGFRSYLTVKQLNAAATDSAHRCETAIVGLARFRSAAETVQLVHRVGQCGRDPVNFSSRYCA